MNDKSKINGMHMGTEKEMQYMLKGIEETSYMCYRNIRPGSKLNSGLLYKHVYFCCGDRA